MTLKLTYLGQHWPHGGDLFYLTNEGGEQARIFVDSLGETWVDIRRVPEGGSFHTERVEAYRAWNGAEVAKKELVERGFTSVRVAPFAHRVLERGV